MRILFLSLALILLVLCASAAGDDNTARREIVIDYTSSTAVNPISAPIDEMYGGFVINNLSESDLTLPESVMLLCADGALREIDFESYIAGVVAAEMPCDFHAEALKAQAVAARSYALYRLKGGHRGDCQLCADFNCCAAYYSRSDAERLFGAEIADKIFTSAESAAEATRGIVMLSDGEAVCAVFHSSSDGVTESSEEVWGGVFDYLTSVSTPEQARLSDKSFSYAELAEKLAAIDININADTRIYSQSSESERAASLVVGDTVIKGTTARRLFSLASSDFDAVYENGILTFHVYGYGHGVGMSQYGAQAMADSGYRFDEILTHYYSGVKLYK